MPFMVTTVDSYPSVRNRAAVGEGLDGVVRVTAQGFYGSGTLLFDGRAVLTSAHLLVSAQARDVTLNFETRDGAVSMPAYKVVVHPQYDAASLSNDLALVWLGSAAPLAAERYSLYRGSDEVGQAFRMVGYGVPGSGQSGYDAQSTGLPVRQKASNTFDAEMSVLKKVMGSLMPWSPLPQSQLLADFDNGTAQQDALGQLLGQQHTGMGLSEGLISPGDSGGPAFIRNAVAGVASYSFRAFSYDAFPDVDSVANSSFGEVASWQRVSFYQQWIDETLRVNYVDAPTRREDVKLSVVEGHSGTSYAYFWLEFTGVRLHASQVLSVDYATRDGTAKAGEDYLPASGTLKLYPGRDYAVIPVEIVGDLYAEPAETFYLDVFNPVGGSFGLGIVTLTAMRTILDDDGGPPFG